MGVRISRALVIAALSAAALAGIPALAAGAEAEPSVPATGAYDLDFTLPTDARAGCMVCHGDPNLTRLRQGATVSFWIDPGAYGASTHAEQACVGCHIDFTYAAPHAQGIAWQEVAKSACKNCKDHADQQTLYAAGAHAPFVPTSGNGSSEETTAPRPLCGDCHGSHEIVQLTESLTGPVELHRRGWEICGRCHAEYWDTYADHYHGAAYKRGALDAPACWDCHGYHDMLPADNRRSTVNESRLVETCGRLECHGTGVEEAFVDYAGFIHGRGEIEAANPLLSAIRTVFGFIRGLLGDRG